MHSLKLLNLLCHVSDESDLDEIYLKHGNEKIWPESDKFQRVNIGETPLNVSIETVSKGEKIEISIWDYDTLSKNDHLGNFTLNLDQYGHFQTEMIKKSGTRASYSLDWEFY